MRKRLARIVRFALQPRIALPAERLVEAEEDERRLLVEAPVRLRRGLSLPHLNEEALHHRVLDEVRGSMDLQEPLNRPHGSFEVICELLCLRELVQGP